MLHKKNSVLWIGILIISSIQCKEVKNRQIQIDHDLNNVVLGWQFTEEYLSLNVFSTQSDSIRILLYENGEGGEPVEIHFLSELADQVFSITTSTDKDFFYTLQVQRNGIWSEEVVDPYVKMVGVNGERGYIANPGHFNPEGWENDTFIPRSENDPIILYELQIRDFSSDSSSGMQNKGKYLAFTEENTFYKDHSTGLDHLAELGVTHVHLMPAFDFRSIDEKLENPTYNWGYEPLHYNVPEGSFASDPGAPASRVFEFKAMVKALHDRNIAVILDVVYNHTSYADQHPFEVFAPGYYYRMTKDGSFSNASACGNETASEQPMMRKFMLESMRYWMEEYHIDGFRVDLMGVHDILTMNMIRDEMENVHPGVLIYGEGWKAGKSPLQDSLLALKKNTKALKDIAVFSDELRDGLKGHYANESDKGFVSGNSGYKESVKFGIVGAIEHPHVSMEKVIYTEKAWSDEPFKMIAYASCHDDMTLWDKLKAANPEATIDELISMHLLANTAVLTSQGIPFLHGGVDFLRTKNGDPNSYKSPDAINSIKWNQKATYQDVYLYYRDLIGLRKAHPAFYLGDSEAVRKMVKFLDSPEGVIAFEIGPHANGDRWEYIRVYLNGSAAPYSISIDSSWKKVIDGRKILKDGLIIQEEVVLPAHTAQILFK